MEKRDELRVFGEIVRKLRVQKGVSQEHLAASACLHRTYISLVERGLRNPSLTVIRQLAAALGVSTAGLVGDFETAVEAEAAGPTG
jgi:transcriptional regulator with XRE-family HTH domain